MGAVEKKIKSIDFVVGLISKRFVGVLDHLEEAIMEGLRELGESCLASRAYVFLLSEDGQTMSNVYEWCAPFVRPEKDNLQDLPVTIFPWWMEKLKKNEMILIEDVEKLGDDARAEREILLMQGVKALIVLPLFSGKTLKGFIGLDNVENALLWSKEAIKLLELSSEIFSNAFIRLAHEKAIADQHKEILNLQTRVIQQEKMAGIGQLAAGVAHEINNPLGFIRSSFATLKAYEGESDLDEDILDIHSEIEEGLERIANIVNALLRFAPIEGKEDYTFFDVNLLIEEILMFLNYDIPQNVNIQRINQKLNPLYGQRGDMGQVIIQLINNALKAIAYKMSIDSNYTMGNILVSTEQQDDTIVITLDDDAMGVSLNEQCRIFEPFYSGNQDEGMVGLGLSLVYDIVENKHKGSVVCSSSALGGARFVVRVKENNR